VKAELFWLPEAQDDLARLYEFIQPHSADAAARAIVTLIEAAEALCAFPEKGAPWLPDPDFRELFVPFGARGYVLRYRVLDDRVLIVRVWHTREDR